MLPTDQYIFSHLNWIYDRMQTTETLTQVCVETDYYTPTQGIAVISGQANLPGASSIGVEEAGVFASASLTALRQRRDVELYDICSTALAKTPRPWNKVSCALRCSLIQSCNVAARQIDRQTDRQTERERQKQKHSRTNRPVL